jgi:hypothetical protein
MAGYATSGETLRFRRLRRSTPRTGYDVPLDALVAEWDAIPLGRLGRRLWADIDRYREFMAIVESPAGDARARGRHAPGHDLSRAG